MAERAIARIDLAAVERNCALLRSRLTGGASLCAVVKADGYGHGAVGCARAALAGGAERLAVATAREAAEIRSALPDASLLTMGALTADELDAILACDSDLAVWDPGFLALVAVRAAEAGRPARVHVKYDSGMGRLGTTDRDLVLALARSCASDPALELAGVWTHFATADDPDDGYFDQQLARFGALAEEVGAEHGPGVTVHAANSAAVLRTTDAHFDMVRCGVAIYGLDPFGADPADHGLEPALSLHSYVAAVKRFEVGASAGYGRSWIAEAPTWVGVLPVGYGDGVRRGLSNNGEVLAGERRLPIVGTVSMDNITVDLGADDPPEQGAEAVLIGSQGSQRILAEDWARRLGTINYEVTCGISARVPRIEA